MSPELFTRTLRICILLGSALIAQSASPAFHLWQLSEIYSNASGTVQYIELSTFDGGQEFIGGHAISASQGASINTFNFPADLPGDTSDHMFLIGTQAFANLGIVAPDYIVPDGFLFLTNGSVNFAGVDSIAYSALPTDGVHALDRSGNSVVNAPTNFAGITGSIPATTPPGETVTGTVVEFYNTNLDNYFITADANEVAGIDMGSAGPGWIHTGDTFKSGGSTPVCRFYGSQSPGPNSHFYTVDASECAALKQLQASTPATQKRWNFESLDFFSTPPINGACPSGTIPVYRAYNNGFTRGVDSNHRITTNLNAIQQAVALGWIAEGVVMCAPQ